MVEGEGKCRILTCSIYYCVFNAQLWVILEDDLSHSVRVSSSKVHFLRMFVYIPTITHIGACIWFMIACFHDGKSVVIKNMYTDIYFVFCRCLKDSWAHQQRLSLNTTALHDYVTSLYWATTTMTTVGYGDITPYNDRDKILAISAMITGIILYGYILGAVAATLTSALASKSAAHILSIHLLMCNFLGWPFEEDCMW